MEGAKPVKLQTRANKAGGCYEASGLEEMCGKQNVEENTTRQNKTGNFGCLLSTDSIETW